MTLDPVIAQLMVEAMSCSARVAGMQAENAQRLSVGESVAYTEVAFEGEAITLSQISQAMRIRNGY